MVSFLKVSLEIDVPEEMFHRYKKSADEFELLEDEFTSFENPEMFNEQKFRLALIKDIIETETGFEVLSCQINEKK